MSATAEKVSGLIITYNEERNIGEVLPCFDFCDEIIVVDSFSTDHTVAIAETFPKVKVIQHKFEDFASQRNIALQHAQNDWVLFLDGDERITPALRVEIIETLASREKKDAYFIGCSFLRGSRYGFRGRKGIRTFVCFGSLSAIIFRSGRCTRRFR